MFELLKDTSVPAFAGVDGPQASAAPAPTPAPSVDVVSAGGGPLDQAVHEARMAISEPHVDRPSESDRDPGLGAPHKKSPEELAAEKEEENARNEQTRQYRDDKVHDHVELGGAAGREPKTPEEAQQRKECEKVAAEAAKKYADLIVETGATIKVMPSSGNGGRPIVMVVPKDYDPTKKTEITTHYHGVNQTVAEDQNASAGLTARMAATQHDNPQAVFVLPESASNTHMDPKNDAPGEWGNVKSITDTTNDALRELGLSEEKLKDPALVERVVSAHSGGGEAIRQALENAPAVLGPDGKPLVDPKTKRVVRTGETLQADRLELRDCLYGGTEAAIADWAHTTAGQNVDAVEYFRGTNGSFGGTDGRSLAKAFERKDAQGGTQNPFHMDQILANDVKTPLTNSNVHDRTNQVRYQRDAPRHWVGLDEPWLDDSLFAASLQRWHRENRGWL
jgi:hypothetical protein